MLGRFRSFLAESRAVIVALSLILILLGFGGLDVQRRVARSAVYQGNIRQALVARSSLIRNQIDEETGVRGYLATQDRRFLEPYNLAVADFPKHVAALQRLLSLTGLSSEGEIAEEERRLNALWIGKVARPLIAHPNLRNLALQTAGKGLVDNFRARDDEMTADLDHDAERADTNFQRALAVQILFLAGLLVTVGCGGIVAAYYLAKTARRAFQSRERYENQKRIADSLQTAFLQKSLPIAPGVGLHAMYVPATTEAQVGGDWYDAYTLPDGRLLFSIGDVAGHGLDAAVVMSRARQAIVVAALQEDDPARVLSRANDSIILQDSRMVTAICGFIDPRTLEISYATAGHPPPVIARPGQRADFLPHEGIPLGIVRGATYSNFTATAAPDALVVFYTDGVIEHKRDIFAGERRLLTAVDAAVGRDDPAVAIHEMVFSGASASDDVAIFTVTFRANEGRQPEATIDALQVGRLSVGLRG